MTPSKKKDEAPETPLQSEEVRNAVIARSTAGGDTAVGNARNEDADVPEGEDRGSTIPIVGGPPEPDFPSHTAPAPIGAQAEPSNFSTNGSLPVNHVASPSGLVPVSAVSTDPQKANQLVSDHLDAEERTTLRSGNEKLSRSKIESMPAGDLRAVAADRGYDIGDYAGARQTRLRFIRAQNDDEDLSDEGSNTPAADTTEE